MLTRFFSLFSALYLALPMYWCCMVQAMPAETGVEAACPTCLEKPSLPAGEQYPGCPGQECPTCTKLVKRNLSPEAAVAPGAVWVDLQTPMWEQHLPLPPFFERVPEAWRAALARRAPPPHQPPLYHRHCSLLL